LLKTAAGSQGILPRIIQFVIRNDEFLIPLTQEDIAVIGRNEPACKFEASGVTLEDLTYRIFFEKGVGYPYLVQVLQKHDILSKNKREMGD
jgi:hypothetical protein